MRLALLGFLGACAHALATVDIETPNWLLWGRTPTGAMVRYPEAAWQNGVDGVVVARICVEKNGRLISASADGPRELGEEVLRVLRTWEWDPVPQPSCFRRRFSFEKDPQPDDFFRTEGEMVVSRAYHPPRPEFVPPLEPTSAEGSVWVRVCPDITGTPKDITVLRGLRKDVDDQIAAGVSTWKYRPAQLRGQAVPACKIERFVLHPGQRPLPAIPNAPRD